MKKRFLITTGTIFLLALLISSCDKWIDPKINEDPDSVVDVPFNLLLPAIEADMGYVMGGMDVRGIVGMWVQHVSGAARQAQTMGRNYSVTEADINNAWNTFYNGFMMDLTVFINKTGGTNPQARGVGKILMATALGQATDLWGDIPYTEAFKGNADLKPAYDTQQSIYAVINTLLTEAIADLGTANGANAIPLGSSSNDLIYNGDKTKWIAAARSLRARYALHLSKKGTADYAAIIADCNAGIILDPVTGKANDMQLTFGTTESNANPLYEFNQERGDVAPSSTFETFATGDPRLPVFAAGEAFGTFYGSISSPVPFMTFVETKFILAEAQLRKTGPSQALANTAYDAAVLNSLSKFGIPLAPDTATVNSANRWKQNNTTYVTTTTLGAGKLTDRNIQNIIEAKYIALFLQTEAYNDYRRTGYPALAPTVGSTIPSRFPYCTDERLYNAESVPTGITLDSKLWLFN